MGTQPYSAATAPASNVPPGYRRPAIATGLLVALLALFFSAGFWQLDRADEKWTVLDSAARAATGDRLTSLVSDAEAADYRFYTFELRGRYLPERQVLLDNMTQDGRNGYQVLTPFLSGTQYVMVNRGWLPAGNDRTQLPDIGVAADERVLIARLSALPAPGLRLAAPQTAASGWPRRMLFPDHAQLQAALQLPLPAYQLQLDPAQPDGYRRDWQTVAAGPAKHFGYALQWFSFAGLACLFYLILMYQWWRSRKAATARLTVTSELP